MPFNIAYLAFYAVFLLTLAKIYFYFCYRPNNVIYVNLYKITNYMVAALANLSLLALFYAFYSFDCSYVIVAQNINHFTPLFYRISALWSCAEGSFFLWCYFIILGNIIFLCAIKFRFSPLLTLSCCLLDIISALFCAFLLYCTDMFSRHNFIQSEGYGLNPLLQDCNLAIHPPLLYAAYAALAMGFCYALARLINIDASERDVHQHSSYLAIFNAICWTFLSCSMLTGSYWAYYVLGWGGYWSFDNIENYALLPWLTSLAYMHFKNSHLTTAAHKEGTAAVAPKLQLIENNIIYMLLGFSFALIGTFFARTSFLFSVHSFMGEAKENITLLVLVLALILPAWSCYIYRYFSQQISSFSSSNYLYKIFYFLLWMAVIALAIGQFIPVLLSVLYYKVIYLDKSYHYFTFIPIMLAVICVLLLYYCSCYKEYWRVILACSLILAACNLMANFTCIFDIYYILPKLVLIAFLGLALIYFLLDFFIARGIKAGNIAHFGVKLMLVGILCSAFFTVHKKIPLEIGQNKQIELRHNFYNINYVKKLSNILPEYNLDKYIFTVNNKIVNIEIKQYTGYNMQVVAVGLVNFALSQLYIVPQLSTNKNEIYLHIAYNDYILLLWIGAIMCIFGGFLAVKQKLTRDF